MKKNVDVLESQWITKPTKATTSSQKQNIHVIDFRKVKTFRRFDNFIYKGKCNQSVISLFKKLENEIQMFNC